MSWFENWFGSPYYTILYENRDEQEAQEFVESLLGYLNPVPGSRMLDIACGEGRFAKQLAEHGYDVTGIDLSYPSIEKAKASEADNLQFFVQDMRLPFYINYFDLAFNFFTSFGYFAHNRDHALAARSFAAALKDGGTLVVDYMNAAKVIANMMPHATVQRGSYTFSINKKVEHHHIKKEISFIDADKKQRHYTESVAAFTLADFEKIFGQAGMELVATFGDYKLGPFDAENSPRLIMIFKKKHV